METKCCSMCNRVLPNDIIHYYACKRNKDGLKKLCKECCGGKFIRVDNTNSIIIGGMKTCSRCKRLLPATKEYFYGSTSVKIRLMSFCKECMGRSFGRYNIRDVRHGDNKLYKTCNHCQQELPATREYFFRHKKSKDRLLSICKRCFMLRHKENICRFPEKRVLKNMRSGMRYALIYGLDKSDSTIKLLGCSIHELRLYLEGLFQDGMTWNNYGKYGWHVDHVRPCASFDLSDPEQQRECFHYTNLQPMWKSDNLRKNSRYNGKLYRRNQKKV